MLDESESSVYSSDQSQKMCYRSRQRDHFAEMIRNEKQQQRYSSLDRRIRELDESEQKESAIGEKGLS